MKEKLHVQHTGMIKFNSFLLFFLILNLAVYGIDYSEYYNLFKNNSLTEQIISSSKILYNNIKENPNNNTYTFIKYLNKLSDSNLKLFETAAVMVLEGVINGDIKLNKTSAKIAKQRLLFLISKMSLNGSKSLNKDTQKVDNRIVIYFPQIKNSSYRAYNGNLINFIRSKVIQYLDNTDKYLVISDKIYVLKNKTNVDYILDVEMYQYDFSVRNHFDRYLDRDDRTYYKYDFSDLDVDIRMNLKLIEFKSGNIVSNKKCFFSRTGTLNLYPGDSRFYGDVPYYWNEYRGTSIYDNYQYNRFDSHYNPYFNDFDDTIQNITNDIIFDKKDGIIKFIIDYFPIRARIIKVDSNPDFIWINAGENKGVFHKLRFSVLIKSGNRFKKVALLRARTISKKTTRCRIHRYNNISYSPKIGDRVISSGW